MTRPLICQDLNPIENVCDVPEQVRSIEALTCNKVLHLGWQQCTTQNIGQNPLHQPWVLKMAAISHFSRSLATITLLQAPDISDSLFQTSNVFVPQDTTGHLLDVLWSPCLKVNLHNIRQVLFNVTADRCMSSDVTCCAEGNNLRCLSRTTMSVYYL